MELLAFTQAAVAYEDSTPIQLRQWSAPEIVLRPALPSSAWVGLLSISVFASIVGFASTASALCQTGDRGTAVQTIQSVLNTAGYYQGAIDGIYGPQTEAAVRAFQGAKALTIDGKVGAQTLAALEVSGAEGRCSSQTPISNRSYRVSSVSGLNVRSSPAGTVIDGLEPGAVVTLTTEIRSAEGHQWVKLADRSGWVAQQYLASVDHHTSTPQTNEPQINTYRVTTPRGLRIRTEANLGAAIVGSLAGGETVSLTNQERTSNGYTWGKLAGRSGWVAKEFLQPARSTTEPTPSVQTPPEKAVPSDQPAPAPASPTPAAVGGEADAIVDQVDYGIGVVAKTSQTQSPVRRQPTVNSESLVTLAGDTFVAVTKQVKLSTGETWYFLPAYNGWADSKALTLVQ